MTENITFSAIHISKIGGLGTFMDLNALWFEKRFRFGRIIISDSFISHIWANWGHKKEDNIKTKQRSNFIILLCLLLTGDIHQFPGPGLGLQGSHPCVSS